MQPTKGKPRAGGQRGASIIAWPGKQRSELCTDIARIAQPISYGGRFIGWLVDRSNGQTEAAPHLGHSLGWFNSGQAALHALIAHAGRHG